MGDCNHGDGCNPPSSTSAPIHISFPPNPIPGGCSNPPLPLVHSHSMSLTPGGSSTPPPYPSLSLERFERLVLQSPNDTLTHRLGESRVEPATLRFPDSNTHSAMAALNRTSMNKAGSRQQQPLGAQGVHWVVGSSIPAYLQLLPEVE